mmetsp:Transcript_24069/g.40359  ORF Transcript_24069/g.40359 Transcript_24069/m.40359 type:complete len:189 (+) Transcript_24069:238-804(+)
MMCFSHAGIMCDDTHGMTVYKENKLLNCGVQAHNGNFFPVGHCLASTVCEESCTLFFVTLKESNNRGGQSINPECGIIDGALEACQALVNVWPDIEVRLCIWHVPNAWRRTLKQKKTWKNYANMDLVLADAKSIMYAMDKDERDKGIEAFRTKWAEEPEALSYFEAEYFHVSRLSMWCLADRADKHHL